MTAIAMKPSGPRRLRIAVATILLLIAPTAGAGDYEDGAEIWRNHCELCHGSDGRGAHAGVPDLWQGGGLYRPDVALEEIIRFGINAMPGFSARLRADDIEDVITYMRMTF